MKRVAWFGAFAVAVVLVVAAVLGLGRRRPEGPAEIAWDDQACAECRMHVGDPAFAAQLQTADGDVLAFDDPGCLLLYQARQKPPVHAIYFHARPGDRWLRASEVAFVRVPTGSPMGYGLAAVPKGTAGSITLSEARRIVATRAPP